MRSPEVIGQLSAVALLVAMSYGIDRGPRPVHAEIPKPTPAAGAAIPTATPTPQDVICIDGSCIDRTKFNRVIQEAAQAALDAEATKQAKNTPTPRPTFAPTPAVGAGSRGNEGGFPWGWVIGIPVFGGAGWASHRLYERWKNWLRRRSGAGTTTGAGPNVGPTPRVGGIAGGTTGGPSNPNTSPSTGSAQPKNPEWVIGQLDFERRWQAVKSKFPPVRPGDTGNEQGYILDRFKAGMSIVHEVSLEDVTNVPEIDTRVRAGIEYLIPEIWPDNRVFKRFFDPRFNAGFLTAEDLARIVYLPEPYRNLSSFTKAQKRDINRIRRTLLHALHPDLLKSDSDPKLQDSIDILLRQINSTWFLVNRLLS